MWDIVRQSATVRCGKTFLSLGPCDMIWVSDYDGRVTYVSPEWATVTGQAAQDALGSGWQAALHGDDVGAVVSLFRSAIRARSPFTVQYRLLLNEGSFVWVVSGAVPSVTPFGEFIGYLGSVTRVDPKSLTAARAGGRLGSFDPPGPDDFTLTRVALGQVADHLLMAHSLMIEHKVGGSLLAEVAIAIRKVTEELQGTDGVTPTVRH